MDSSDPALPLQRRPLYRQVSERIRSMLLHCTPGERIETEAALLRRFDVSILTLRRAMEELEREGLIEKRQGSGTFYLGDSGLQRKHVAVLLDVDETSPNLSPYFPKIVRSIRKDLKRLGIASRPYQGDLPLGIEPTGITSQDLLEDVRLERISGMISFFTRREDGWLSLFRKHHIPIIDPEFSHKHLQEPSFLPWCFEVIKARGCQKIAALSWESSTDNRHPFSRKFQELSREYNVPIVESLLDMTANGWEPGMGWERFRDIWRRTPEKPDALIIGDDMIFPDIQKAILELGINVPEDLTVLVRTSDIFPLNVQIPVGLHILEVDKLSRIYAQSMAALLKGEPLPSCESWPTRTEFVGMEADQEEYSASLAP